MASRQLGDVEHLHLLTAYGVKDALVQGRALPLLLEDIRTYGTGRGFMADCRLAPTIRDMGLLGMPQDKLRAARFAGQIRTRMAALEEEMREISGLPKLNPRSSDQVAKYLYETRGLEPALNPDGEEWEEGDGWSVGRPALFALEDAGVPEDVKRFIQAKIKHGSLGTLLSTNIARVFDCPEHPSDPARLTWLQPSFRKETTTGRLVSNPNVQNYTTRGAVNTRTLFVPPPGHVFIVTDSEQLELRLYAGESGDAYYTKAFQEGLDAHSLNVVSLLAKPGSSEGEIMDLYRDFMARLTGEKGSEAKSEAKKVRTLYKSVVFSMLYGSGPAKVFVILSQDCDKATGVRFFGDLKYATIEKVYKRFKQVHPWLDQWHQTVDEQVRRNGYVEEKAGGRRLVYPEGMSEPNGARNFTIQGAAATKIDESLEAIAEAYPYQSLSEWTGVFNQVHDEVALCVPVTHAKEAYEVCREAFRGEFRGIPLLGEPEIQLRYADKPIPLEMLTNDELQ